MGVYEVTYLAPEPLKGKVVMRTGFFGTAVPVLKSLGTAVPVPVPKI